MLNICFVCTKCTTSASIKNTKCCKIIHGPVAERITRLTTNQEIAGSNPAMLDIFLLMCTYLLENS